MLFLIVIAAQVRMTAVNAAIARNSSWMAHGSRIAEDCLADLKRLHPYLPRNSLVYVESNREKNILWYFDSGRFAASFYEDLTIRMRFSGDGMPAPSPDMTQPQKIVFLKYIDGRLFDITPRRHYENADTSSYRIRDHWKEGYIIQAGRKIPAGSQNEKLVFVDEFALRDSARDTLVLIPGITYVHPLPEIRAGSRLRFGVAISNLLGDGLMAELKLVGPMGETGLYSRHLSAKIPATGHNWEDTDVELNGVQGPGYSIMLTAQPIPGSNRFGHWLEWAPLEIVPPESQNMNPSLGPEPPQPNGLRFFPTKIRRGETVTIEVIGGGAMLVDCRYTLNSSGPPQTLEKWLKTDSKGIQILTVNTPGYYVISAIRNNQRSDWVPVHLEFECVEN